MTKALPAIPINNRKKMRPVKLVTSPVIAIGIDAASKTNTIGKRAPHLSVIGPKRKRQKMPPTTNTMLVVQISFLSNSSVSFTSGRRGAMENHMKYAIIKDHHE